MFKGSGYSWPAPILNAAKPKSVIKAAGDYKVEFDIKLDTVPDGITDGGIKILARYDGDSGNALYGTIAESKDYEAGTRKGLLFLKSDRICQ